MLTCAAILYPVLDEKLGESILLFISVAEMMFEIHIAKSGAALLCIWGSVQWWCKLIAHAPPLIL